ncbi:hypothetical protein WMC41_21545 [Shinella yambaruensis]|uniref:hypothetical protein n=1 Tax=Shinella yambaruensis TaxID=415996 RepID=UPI003D7B015D
MILTVKRQMIILQAYVPIAPITQGRKGKILFCQKGRGGLCARTTKLGRPGLS